jgi:hypothetical protein
MSRPDLFDLTGPLIPIHPFIFSCTVRNVMGVSPIALEIVSDFNAVVELELQSCMTAAIFNFAGSFIVDASLLVFSCHLL